MRSRFSLEKWIEDIAAFYAKIEAAGVRPLSVGGDHSITYPILKSLGAKRPVGLVHIDAHCDTSGEYSGAKFHHVGPFPLPFLYGLHPPAPPISTSPPSPPA